MLKAIRKMVFLLIPMLLIFLLLQGIVGEKGYLVNKELEKINEANEEVLARLEVQRDALQKYEDSLSSQEALDDIALKLGYNKDGEQVYFFTEQDIAFEDLAVVGIERGNDQLSFKGIAAPWLALISFGVVIIPYLIISLILFFVRRNKSDDYFENVGGGYNDYSF